MNLIKQYANALIALAVLALLVAGAFGVRAYNDNLREQGREEVRAEWQASINTALIERNREISRLVAVTRNWSAIHDKYRLQIDALARARDADAVRLQRLTEQRRAAIAAASDVPALRAYATAAGDVYEACRSEYTALGLDAERCTAAAHTLKGWADEVTEPTKPAAPLQRLGTMFSKPSTSTER